MGSEAAATTPAIVMVASNLTIRALVLPAAASLGRRIEAEGTSHEMVDERMSHQHATVRWVHGSWQIRDLESRNGTYVNGERIHGEVRRRGNVLLRLGHTLFVLVEDGRGYVDGDVDLGDPGDLIVGPELAAAHAQLQALAREGAAVVMVQGAAGSGKQTAARVYHAATGRDGPFIAVNCQGVQGVAMQLIFGGKRGVIETIGQLQLARGGTLYLANIAELDAVAQGHLVELLARGDADPRIACSGADLRLAVADGRLREDLAARLAAACVVLPPLRARRVDLIRLIQREVGALEVHPRLIESCVTRPWPGNVPELRAGVQLAARRAREDGRTLIRPEDLPDTAGYPPGASSGETAVERKSGNPIDHSPAMLAAALHHAQGSLSVAARQLNLHRTQLAKLLEDAAIPFVHDDA